MGEALKAVVYISNRVPSKYGASTPSELLTVRKLSLSHFIFGGYPAEVKIYCSSSKKTNQRIVICYFIVYAEKPKGYKYYYTTRHTIILGSTNAFFFEDTKSARVGI